MRPWSLRGWLLFVSVLFAVLVVGGVALTTYVIVADGMQSVVLETTERVASAGAVIAREAVVVEQAAAETEGLTGDELERNVRLRLKDSLPDRLAASGLTGARFALYDADGSLLWYSSPQALYPQSEQARRGVMSTGKTRRTVLQRADFLRGLVREAQLGVNVVHVPLRLLGDSTGVLDVAYVPSTEEQVIDRIRLPMLVLAISAMVVMAFLMQTSMTWVLNLVDELRRAADSIDAGRLDERLPELGENEIGALARSLNQLIERLGRRAEAQARFVADASHELATPVAGIRGYTSILRAWGSDDPKVREEAIDAIDRESRRMARLTSDLLNLLHADQGLRLKTEQFDLNAIVRDRLASTASRFIERGIEFEGPDDESLIMVGDPGRVEDVLSILLDNAAKYTSAGGRVSVKTWRRREMITIFVADTGKGIPRDDLPRLFDRFFRSEAARAAGEGGFGLGLAIAKSILDNMNGTIAVDSEPGVGTTFLITLPRGRI